MNIVTPQSMKAAYDFLKRVSFSGLKLPKSSTVTFESRRLKKYHGYFVYPENIIVLDNQIDTVGRMLQIMAHEMIHAVLEQNAASDHEFHDDNFYALARIIEAEMGWPKGKI